MSINIVSDQTVINEARETLVRLNTLLHEAQMRGIRFDLRVYNLGAIGDDPRLNRFSASFWRDGQEGKEP